MDFPASFFTFVKFNPLQSGLKSISTRFIRVCFYTKMLYVEIGISFDFVIAFGLASFAHKTNHCYTHLGGRKIVILHKKNSRIIFNSLLSSRKGRTDLCASKTMVRIIPYIIQISENGFKILHEKKMLKSKTLQ